MLAIQENLQKPSAFPCGNTFHALVSKTSTLHPILHSAPMTFQEKTTLHTLFSMVLSSLTAVASNISYVSPSLSFLHRSFLPLCVPPSHSVAQGRMNPLSEDQNRKTDPLAYRGPTTKFPQSSIRLRLRSTVSSSRLMLVHHAHERDSKVVG